ncbi:MAG: hypothetical protein ABI838_01650 [Chloroflexota bacterium]
MIAGVGSAVLTALVVFVMVAVFAIVSGVQARGAPDSASIARFANDAGTWLGPPLTVAATAAAAAWVARKARFRVQLHGVLVGLVAAVVGLALAAAGSRSFHIGAVFIFAVVVAAGWFSGWLAGRGLRTT